MSPAGLRLPVGRVGRAVDGQLGGVHVLAVHLDDTHHLSLLGLPVEADTGPFVRRRTTRPEHDETDGHGGREGDQHRGDHLAQMGGYRRGRAMAVRVGVLMALRFWVAMRGRHRPIIARRKGPSVQLTRPEASVVAPLHTRELGAPG
ncbi:hypothetical protein JCM13580A_32560 [Streptomyces drozdowiczii]